jgi:hypothetical protein
MPGDTVELSSAVLGTLRNTLAEPGVLAWAPPRREPGVTLDGRGGVQVTELLQPRADAAPPPFPRTGP